MDFVAKYTMVDDPTLDWMMELDDDGIVDMIDLEKTYIVEELWDCLHFVLTGGSAGEPIEGDLLSESIAGIHVFNDDDDAEFIGCTESGELEDIISAMENADLDEMRARLNAKDLEKADIYPFNWKNRNMDVLWNELQKIFTELIQFYRDALNEKMNVVVTIL